MLFQNYYGGSYKPCWSVEMDRKCELDTWDDWEGDAIRGGEVSKVFKEKVGLSAQIVL